MSARGGRNHLEIGEMDFEDDGEDSLAAITFSVKDHAKFLPLTL
jgi:hypothetical protein